MKRPLVKLAVIGAVLGHAASATAGVTEDLARNLDGDATAVARLELRELIEGIGLLARLQVPKAQSIAMIAGVGGSAMLGFNPLDLAGWRKAGFDADAPVLVSVALNYDQAEKLYARVRTGGSTSKLIVWRGRLVMRLVDPRRADASLRRLIAKTQLLGVQEVSRRHGSKVAPLLGARPRAGAQVVRALRRLGAIAVAPLSGGALLLVRRLSNTLVLDLVRPFGGRPLVWSRDSAALLGLIGRAPPRKGFAARLKSGAAKRVATSGSVLWLDAANVTRAGYAVLRDRLLALHRRLGRTGTPLPVLPKGCRDFLDVARRGAFRDLAFAARITPRRVTGTVTWGNRTAFGMGAPFAVFDDRLIAGRVAPASSVVSGALYMRAWYPLRSLPRPPIMKRNWQTVWLAAIGCGPGAAAALALFGWPQQIGLLLDEIASINKDAETLVLGARNLAFSIRRVSFDPARLRGGFEASLTPAAHRVAARLLNRVFASSARGKNTRRSYRTWGHGPVRPFSYTASGGKPVLGVAYPPPTLSWYLARAAAAARSTPRRGLLGWLDADGGKVLAQLGAAKLAPTRMWAAMIRRLGLLRARIEVTQDLVEASFTLDIK